MHNWSTVWDDLEFFERTIEFSNEHTRKKFEQIIKQARFKIIQIIETDFLQGNILPATFKNVVGREPDKELISQNLEFHRERTDSNHNDFNQFAKQALKIFAHKPRQTQ